MVKSKYTDKYADVWRVKPCFSIVKINCMCLGRSRGVKLYSLSKLWQFCGSLLPFSIA